MKEIRIIYDENIEPPIVDIRENGMGVQFEKMDSYDRWKIIEKIDEVKEKLIKIHQSSW